MTTIDRLLRQPARPVRQFAGAHTARVHSIAADGRLNVTTAALGPGVLVGPCRWQRPDTATSGASVGDHGSHTHAPADPAVPPTGTTCLLVFTDAGMADPWIVAFDGWPA